MLLGLQTSNSEVIKNKRLLCKIRAAESESESESAGVGSFDRSRSRSRSRQIFIDSDSGPESESVTALFHYFLPSQDENKDGNRTVRAICRRPRWFVVYGALSAGVAFVSGLISLQP